VKRLAAISAALVLAGTLSACGIASDDIAATVAGKEISTADVARLARTDVVGQQAQAAGLVSATPGTTGGSRQRAALSILVQTAIFEDAVRSRGGKITGADTAAAESQLSQFEQQQSQQGGKPLSASTRKMLKDYVAAQTAIVRLLELDADVPTPTDADIAQYFEDHKDQFDVVLTCVDGFAVTADKSAAAQEAIDGGADAATVLATPELAAQSLSQQGGEQCIAPGQVQNEDLARLVEETPVGTWRSAVVPDESGQTSGTAVFIRANSRAAASPSTPSVAQEISQAIQQEAQQKAQAAATRKTLTVFKAAEVDIDPRYGTWDPSQPNDIQAPTAPALSARDATTTTTPQLSVP
jgi:hypothetical protein